MLDDTGGRVKAQGSFQSLKDQRIDFETTLKNAQQVRIPLRDLMACFCLVDRLLFCVLICIDVC